MGNPVTIMVLIFLFFISFYTPSICASSSSFSSCNDRINQDCNHCTSTKHDSITSENHCHFCLVDQHCYPLNSLSNPCQPFQIILDPSHCENHLLCDIDICRCPHNSSTSTIVLKPPVQSLDPTSNGCGSNFHLQTPPEWNFESICNVHDICYGTCGSSKSVCDENLCNGLVRSCHKLEISTNSTALVKRQIQGCLDKARFFFVKLWKCWEDRRFMMLRNKIVSVLKHFG